MGFQPGSNIYTQGFGSSPEGVAVPYIQNRAPTSNDIVGTGGAFSIGQRWIQTGITEFVLISLSNVSGALQANWIDIQSGDDLLFRCNSGTASPVNGVIFLTTAGTSLPNASSPNRSFASGNAITFLPQASIAVASEGVGNQCGICTFNSSQFTVTPSTGWVSLATNPYVTSTWTPTLTGLSSAGTTTYVIQTGYYIQNGNMIWVYGEIAISAATGTGNAVIGGLPFTIKSGTFPEGSILFNSSGWSWPASTTQMTIQGLSATTTANAICFGSGVSAASLQMTNATIDGLRFVLTYSI